MNVSMLKDQAELWHSFILCLQTKKSWSAERFASVMYLAYFDLKMFLPCFIIFLMVTPWENRVLVRAGFSQKVPHLEAIRGVSEGS